jgi:hypothetical protein
MNHVPKQQWMGCAVATAAMLADLSYEEVAAHWPDLDEARMRYPRELCTLLEAVTDTEWQLSPCWHPQPHVHQFSFPQWPVAVFIQDAALRPRFGQWIVLKDKIVHDPGARTAYSVTKYPLRDWVVTCVAHPVRPDDLARCRARKRLARLRNLLQLWGAEPTAADVTIDVRGRRA